MPRLPALFAAALAAPLAFTAPLSAAEPLTKQTVSADQAEDAVEAALAEAKARAVNVAIVVVDDHGDIVAAHRMDGVKAAFFEVARRKALTSAEFGSPSKNMQDAMKNGFMAVLAFDGVMPLQGAVPIKIGDEVIGAVGTSGASSEVDEAISQAGANAAVATPEE